MERPLAQAADEVGDGGLGEAEGLQLHDLVALERLEAPDSQPGGVTEPDVTEASGVALRYRDIPRCQLSICCQEAQKC